MKISPAVVFTVALAASGSVFADLPLAQAQGCMGCHQVDKKLVGPAWKDVAARYRDDKGAEAKLVKKVREGGKGNWGDILQPPNTTTSDADLQRLVKFVLSLK
ncbi:MAG: c-type cytochrome [Rhodocyclaceae bacterium]|jgi:cytochrome c|nr:c-type cytochrome [Rhodocyclaceae bacterium]